MTKDMQADVCCTVMKLLCDVFCCWNKLLTVDCQTSLFVKFVYFIVDSFVGYLSNVCCEMKNVMFPRGISNGCIMSFISEIYILYHTCFISKMIHILLLNMSHFDTLLHVSKKWEILKLFLMLMEHVLIFKNMYRK